MGELAEGERSALVLRTVDFEPRVELCLARAAKRAEVLNQFRALSQRRRETCSDSGSTKVTDADLIDLATRDYARVLGVTLPSPHDSTVERMRNQRFVVLRNGVHVLAVYVTEDDVSFRRQG